jgi:FMN reductase
MTRILGLAGEPEAGERTATAVAGVLAGAAGQGAETELRELSQTALPEVIEASEARMPSCSAVPSTGRRT